MYTGSAALTVSLSDSTELRVIGTTDKTGGTPVDRPVHVQEVFATMYQHLGIDVNSTKIDDLNGRPRYLVDEDQQPIAELT